MDAQEKLALDSDLAVAVLVGHEDGESRLNLVNLGEELPFDCQMILAQRCCRYIGVLAIRDGVVSGQPADFSPATISAMWAAVEPFTVYATKKLARLKASSGLGWLERLHSLPDLRSN
jgi:hypothetical protein